MTQREKKFIGILVALVAVAFAFKLVTAGSPSKRSAKLNSKQDAVAIRSQADDILLRFADARRGSLKSNDGYEKFAAEIRESDRSAQVTATQAEATAQEKAAANVTEEIPPPPPTTAQSAIAATEDITAVTNQNPVAVDVANTADSKTSIAREAELLERIALLEAENTLVKRQKEDVEKEVASFKQQTARGATSESALKSELADREQQIEELQGKLDQAKDYEAQTRKLTAEIESLRRDNSQISKLSGERSELNSAVAALKQSLDSLRSNRKQLEDKAAQLEEQLEKERRAAKEDFKSIDERSKVRVTRLETELEQKDKDLKILAKRIDELDKLNKDNAQKRDELKKLQQELAERVEENLKLSKNLTEERTRIEGKEKVLSDLKGELNNKIREAEECSVKLVSADQSLERLRQLEAEKVSLESELLLAKEEVSRLMPRRAATPMQESQKAPAMTSELMRVRVMVDVANVRSQAGEEHSALMQVTRGTELVVEERLPEWFRVRAAKGDRGYIKRDVVVELDRNGLPIPTPYASRPTAPPTVPFVQRQDDDSINDLKQQFKARTKAPAAVEPPPGFEPAPELSAPGN